MLLFAFTIVIGVVALLTHVITRSQIRRAGLEGGARMPGDADFISRRSCSSALLWLSFVIALVACAVGMWIWSTGGLILGWISMVPAFVGLAGIAGLLVDRKGGNDEVRGE